MRILLNGEDFELENEEVSYEQLCKAAGVSVKKTPTVTYCLRHGNCHMFMPGETTKLDEGAVVHVSIPGKA
jgi:hypothetical protein